MASSLQDVASSLLVASRSPTRDSGNGLKVNRHIPVLEIAKINDCNQWHGRNLTLNIVQCDLNAIRNNAM